jgi:CIC family chloride channel protein
MQIGAALGSTCGHYLRVGPRERRVLMVAGIAAGISAVFRTPLGAALIAIEMLYRDDFESEALIPAVLASVVAYSVSITVFGQATLFGYLTPHPFVAEHLPLYVGLAIVLAAGGSLFVGAMRVAQRIAKRIPITWLRPAIGGLGLGLFVLVMIHTIGPLLDRGDQGLGLLGGGYGAAQVSITGSDWIPIGWEGVQILLFLGLAKVVASSFTIGFGGSAGDFAPALSVGALLGGAYGLAASLLLEDPRIQPGAFALVGMGALYGGIANTPIAAVVMVCEMAGSYDLLVPLMFVQGITFVALRRITLYPAQPRTIHDSPVHRRRRDPLRLLRVRDVITVGRPVVTVPGSIGISELVATIENTPHQDVFPVLDEAGVLRGVVEADALRMLVAKPELQHIVVAADVMEPAVAARLDDDLRRTAELMIERDLHAVPVFDDRGTVVALLDQHDIAKGVMRVADAPPNESTSRLRIGDL